MTTFEEREMAYESQFARDAEMEFLAQASRNKHIAYWAAAKMGHSAEQAVRYAKDIIRTDLQEGGEDAVVRKLVGDMGEHSTEERVRELMAELLIEARKKAHAGELVSIFSS